MLFELLTNITLLDVFADHVLNERLDACHALIVDCPILILIIALVDVPSVIDRRNLLGADDAPDIAKYAYFALLGTLNVKP